MMDSFNNHAPGFICVVNNFQPFSNEKHTICCVETQIIWQAQISEGKDRPHERGPKYFNLIGNTVGICSKCVSQYLNQDLFFNSEFCVVKGIVEVYSRGGYGAAIIKK